MTNHFEVNMDEYLPLRDVVFKTLRQAILKGELEPGNLKRRTGTGRAPDGDPACGAAWREPYPDP